MSAPTGHTPRPSIVPHRVHYVFADFPEAVPVDCWCDHDGDHFAMYPVHEELVRPLVDGIVRCFRRFRRRRRLRLFRRLTREGPGS